MTTDTNPLTDIDLERTVLGQMLAFPQAYSLYLDAGLDRACFYRGVHGLVWEAIQAVDAKGEVPDILTVWQELKRTAVDDAVGQVYYGRLIDGIPMPGESQAVALTARLHELAALRIVQESAQILEREVSTNPAALAEHVLARHLTALEVVLTKGGARAYCTADAQLEALAQDIQLDKQGKIWFGWPLLDDAIDGCRRGEVCGLMARPGIGKTLVLGHVTRVTAEAELPHVFFSLEMPKAQIVERLARAVYRLGRHELRAAVDEGTIDRVRYTRIFESLVIVDTPGLSVSEMGAALRTIQRGVFRDRPIRLVTIDHLGLIGGDRKLGTYDRVSVQSREVKELAKRLNATVLLAVQVHREAGGDGSKELSLGSARDSGVVEEAMDYLIGMRRLDQSLTLAPVDRERYRDCIFAKVIKNRHGMNGKEIGIRFDPRTLMLTEDPHLQAEQNDLARIAQMGGRR